jgi:DNA polymerase I-like protein with 3'-5' exonuclease and polymerase domains/uracil-DNA glycosylase
MGMHTYTPEMKTDLCKGCPSYREVCANIGTGGPKSAHLVIIPFMPTHHAIIGSGSFLDLDKSMISRVVREVQKKRYKDLKVYYSYSVRTISKPTADHKKHCAVLLKKELAEIDPAGPMDLPVFITTGSEPLKALGLPVGKIETVFGKSLDYSLLTPLGEKKTKIFPLVSPKKLAATPGLLYQVERIFDQAIQRALGIEIEPIKIDYRYPRSPTEVAELITEIFYYQRDGISPMKWNISVDTETNTLYPYDHPDPRMLMISIGWDEGKAATILVDHPSAGYSKEERDQILDKIRWLLESGKPKVFHNYKYDLKFLEMLYKIKVSNVKWDSLLGEHFLDEDKKDMFSLKKIGPIYAPAYQAYDEELKQELRKERETGEVYTDQDLFDMYVGNQFPDNLDSYDDEKYVKWCTLGAHLLEQATIKERIKIVKGQELKLAKSALARSNKAIKALKTELQLDSPNKKKKAGGFEHVPLETLVKYASADADVTWQVLRGQIERISREGTMNSGVGVMRALYIPVSRVIAKMEYCGFAVDKDYMKVLEREATSRAKNLTNDLIGLTGVDFNPNSPPQTFKVMFENLQFTAIAGVFTESTNKKAMDMFVKHYAADDPRAEFAEKLIQYREAKQVLKTINKSIKGNLMSDGRIHCSFHLQGTTTGRLSSTGPNMQNLSGVSGRRLRVVDGEEVVLYPGYNIKKLFVPSKPGHVIVNCDISGAELRVLTAYAPDADLIAALNEGKDIHSFVASKIYKIDYEEIKAKKNTDIGMAKKRKIAKTCVFCTAYGGGPKKIGEQAEIPLDEAKQTQAFFFQSFPGIQDYIDKIKEEVKRYKKVSTLFGRYRRFPNLILDYDNSQAWNSAYREAINFKIQSTSSDLVLSQLVEIDENIAEIEGELLITVHDSYVLQVPEKNIDKLYPFFDKYITQRVAEKFAFLPVKFAYDLEIGPSYGETEALERPKERDPE